MESEVINEFLEDCYPDPPMLPMGDPIMRAKARIVSRFHDLYLEPCLRKLYGQVSPISRDAATIARVVAEFKALLTQLQVLLVPDSLYAVADTITLADCGYPALFLYVDLILPALGHTCDWAAWPRLEQWQRSLLGNAHVQETLAELRPAAEQWMQKKLAVTA